MDGSSTSNLLSSKSDLLSFRDLSCEIPEQHLPLVALDFSPVRPGRPVGGVSIQLSNDGQTFSNESSNYIAYDSKCVECNSTTDCRWKVRNNSLRPVLFVTLLVVRKKKQFHWSKLT